MIPKLEGKFKISTSRHKKNHIIDISDIQLLDIEKGGM